MRTDVEFWLKFLNDSDLSIDNNILLQYATVLANRFAIIDEFLTVDENELLNLGITNQCHRDYLIKQAHLFDDKENFSSIRQSAVSNHILENWRCNNQSTPLNPKSKCNLSPALLSRISYNDHPTCDESTNIYKKYYFQHVIETPERILMIDSDEKIKTIIDSCQKKASPTSSSHGMRTLKSLSDTISVQKKIISGIDRLKRLTLSNSIVKRQTALMRKKVTNITNKFINPFKNIKTKNEPTTTTPHRLTINNFLKRIQDSDKQQQPKEQRKLQLLNLNTENRSSTQIISHQDGDESKRTVQPIQTLATKRFKLGATTTFLTRSIANLGHIE